MMDLKKTVWKGLGLLVLAVLFSTQAMAQASGLVDEWSLGKIYLANGDSINGKITYHRTEDLIKVVKEDGGVVALAPVAVRGFEAVDKDGRFRRVFVTHKWNFGNDYSDFQAPAFFEQIAMGKYGLLRRETMVRKDISRDPYYRNMGGYYPAGGYPGAGPYYVDARQDIFFLLLPSGKVKELRNVKKDLEVVFGKKNGQMKTYIKQNKLKYTSLPDLVKIVTYFGTIS
ncbi:hypothetical protein TH61_10595 [Rufibacter sp. DG15C]|uniref:hypothetical protein n=1 Tax=Rufibacter sp. DG15C TaxID=1379909 RepID=UPI00078C0445|nr:hypothetical protein [Rufibacter sp. DG15C]AMM51531.1 hypothetical protein TH61_10595 [Rufibacter sp. DG15C]